MMKWTTKFSTVLGCALAAVFLFTSTMEVGAVPLTSSPSGTTTTTTTDTNAAEDGNADAAAEDNAAEDNAAGTAAAGTVTSATVTSSSVNIRSEASTSASVAGKAASGQELTVTGETQGSDGKTWYAVTFDNVSGYIRSDLVEAHVSEATAEPAVDETQETEEPEEEPIVDNSADYSVAFEDDGSGSSAWYLHDNTMGTRYQVSDLLNAEETNKNNQATIDQTAKSMRFVVILMAFVIVVLIIVVTILIIKVRSTYEDYDDYDDDEEDDEDDEDDDEDEDEEEEEERPRRFGRKKPARYVEEDDDEDDDDDEDEDEEEERPRRRPAKKAPVKKPVRRPRVDEYEDEDDEDEDEEEEEERPRRKKGKSKDWQSRNFLDDDDLEFEFLDLK
ncbi:SH3 domain-containing protein [Gallintestinimicrobium sp.]|uniref:SH3 domain-containing protein n=1 Tax=Gallintestinimicrobium sp. TaxID=2981655 RepID=UPI00307BEAB3